MARTAWKTQVGILQRFLQFLLKDSILSIIDQNSISKSAANLRTRNVFPGRFLAEVEGPLTRSQLRDLLFAPPKPRTPPLRGMSHKHILATDINFCVALRTLEVDGNPLPFA